MKHVIALLAAATVLIGCTTTDPYTRETKTSHTTRGAIFGALGGAAIGALTNTSSGKQAAKNALIGAGIGALAGGAVGAYMDNQEKKLRERLEGTGVGIRRTGDTIQLIMPGNITFATDSADVSSGFYPVLDDVALVLNEFDKSYVQVEGHTDSTGSTEYNQELSQRRANSVANYLVNREVIPGRLIVRGYGETQPVADNGTPTGRRENRRVEIEISPYTS